MYLRKLFKHWTLQVFAPEKLLRLKYEAFKELLRHDKKSLELISELEEILLAGLTVDWARVEMLLRALRWSVGSLIRSLSVMHPAAYRDLEERFQELEAAVLEAAFLPEGDWGPPYTLTLAEAGAAPDLAGGKAHTLGRLAQKTRAPVPPGFVVTTHSFHLFIQHNQLRHRLDELLAEAGLNRPERLEEVCRGLEAMILEGEVPPPVQDDIQVRLREFHSQGIHGPWVARSSAVNEDGEASFAGQYTSILNVQASEALAAYKQVLASKYSPRAVAYRLRCGLADQETPMAVLFLGMIEARVSGVVYTREVRGTAAPTPCLAIYAVPGLGHRLVDGSTIPEIHYFTREKHPRPLDSFASPHCPVQPDGRWVCLPPETAATLAEWGMTLEHFQHGPQDIEWCQDHQGRVFLLQSRPLRRGPMGVEEPPTLAESAPPSNPILLAGGLTASPGVGVGRVWLVRNEDDFAGVPEGVVLVSPTLPPTFAAVIERLKAVVADGGSPASRFATVAREAGLPVVVGTLEASRRLAPGNLVTVDATHAVVYEGKVEGLEGSDRQDRPRPATPAMTRLRRLMAYLSPLSLIDPDAPDFAPKIAAVFMTWCVLPTKKAWPRCFPWWAAAAAVWPRPGDWPPTCPW
ncbi:MAG: PEP/pyruvate-binding domain-containing protein [Desulfobaccales bacterium]